MANRIWDLDDKITFGTKHRGKTIEQVCESAPQYLEWCTENLDRFELSKEAEELAVDNL